MIETKAIEDDLRSAPPIKVPHRKAAKYQHVKARLASIAKRYPPGTRLPPIRTLSALFKITPAPIQRAIAELGDEGTLIARAGSGVYVADSAAREQSTSPRATHKPSKPAAPRHDPLHLQPKHITFKIRSARAHHMTFWREATKNFETHNPSIKIDLTQTTTSQGEDPQNNDLIEVSYHQLLPTRPNPWLDPSGFMQTDDPRPSREPAGTAACHVPIHQSVPCIYLNLDMLERAGCQAPAYGTFQQQLDYLEQTTKRATSVIQNPTRKLINIAQPVIWMGEVANTLVEMVQSDVSSLQQKRDHITAAMRSLIALYQLTEIHPPLIDRAIDWFTSQQTMMMIALSYDIGKVKRADVPFRWACYPFLSTGDRVTSVALCAAINRQTPVPVECVRFIKHLQSPETQKNMLRHHLIPLRASDASEEMFTGNSAVVRRILDEAHHVDPQNAHDTYMLDNIINDELAACFKAQISIDQMIDNILQLGRAYSQHYQTMHDSPQTNA